VAPAAVLAEPAVVNVVLSMAIDTARVLLVVPLLLVAVAAGYGPVPTHERVRRVIHVGGARAIEAHRRRVASSAVGAEFPLVRVLMAVAAGGLSGPVEPLGVATRAVLAHLRVSVEAAQGEPGIDVVIERVIALAPLDVTARARLVRELPAVGAPVRVAARAGALRVVEALLRPAVTARAGELRVPAA